MDGLVTDVEPCLLFDPHSHYCLTQDISLIACNFCASNFFNDLAFIVVLDKGDVGFERVFFVCLNRLFNAILEKVLGYPFIDEGWLDVQQKTKVLVYLQLLCFGLVLLGSFFWVVFFHIESQLL